MTRSDAPGSFVAPLLATLVLTLGACEAGDDGSIEETGDSETGEVEEAWVPARGIAIVEVEANQGTAVTIAGPEGQWIDGPERNAYLVSERDTLIRVHWTVAEGWVAHEVEARLRLWLPEAAEPIEWQQRLLVADDSIPHTLEDTFYFSLAAAQGHTVPGAFFQVELFERNTEQQAELPELAAVAPEARGQIGFESAPMDMHLRLIPIHYTGGGRDLRPDLSEDRLEALIDALYEQNPVQEIHYEIPYEHEYDEELIELGDLLPVMVWRKLADFAPDNVYYHALINVGSPTHNNYRGIGYQVTDIEDDSTYLVAVTVVHDDIVDAAKTFVHEIGHNQGLQHVACPGKDAIDPNPDYPYEQGAIGRWGFGIRSITLHHPTVHHDYMSYCDDRWASDWTFAKTFQRIRKLTSWGAAPGPSRHEHEVLVGALYADGRHEWFTSYGELEPEDLRPGEAIEFTIGGEVVTRGAAVSTLSDGRTEWVFAAVPEGFSVAELDGIVHVRDGQRREVDPAEVRINAIGGRDVVESR